MSGEPMSESRTQTPRPFDMAVFDQDRVWLDAAGNTYHIDEMSEPERDALYAWLREHSRHFYIQALRAALVQTSRRLSQGEPALLGGPQGQLPALLFASDLEWLHQTRLVGALRH